MPQTSQLSSMHGPAEQSATIAVLIERISALTESMEQVRASLQHMATKEQVAQLVSRSEFEVLSWRVKALDEKMRDSSPMQLWSKFTLVVAGVASVVSLWVALTGWRPGP